MGSDLDNTELQIILNNIKEDIEANLKPENIKAGVTILGIVGTCEGTAE